MRRSWIELAAAGSLCVCLVGCRPEKPTPPAAASGAAAQGPSPGSPQAPAPAETAPAPVVAAKQPYRYERPPIEQDATAGVRGAQTVDFVVTQHGKSVEGARVRVMNAKGKSAGEGTTDDWGEFHTGLDEGRYKVSVEWNGKTTTQVVTVTAGTNTVDVTVPGTQD